MGGSVLVLLSSMAFIMITFMSPLAEASRTTSKLSVGKVPGSSTAGTPAGTISFPLDPKAGSVLSAYLAPNASLFQSRGQWYNIVKWAARTHNCDGRPESVACMACAMDLPRYALAAGVAPIAVGNELWFAPERGATCSMCLRVYMLNSTANATTVAHHINKAALMTSPLLTTAAKSAATPQSVSAFSFSQITPDNEVLEPLPATSVTPPYTGLLKCDTPEARALDPRCPGQGDVPYYPNVAEPWAYGAKIEYDDELGLPYFTGVVIEWFDRDQAIPYALSYPAQGNFTDFFGNWPIMYRAVPCPVHNFTLAYSFLNVSTEVPIDQPTNQTSWIESAPSVGGLPDDVASALCNNGFGKPCSEFAPESSHRPPLQYIKMMVTGQRVPIASIRMFLQGAWYTTKRSGDNYWQLDKTFPPQTQDPNDPINIEVTCSESGTVHVEKGVIPADMMCKYQDPDCITWQGRVQC